VQAHLQVSARSPQPAKGCARERVIIRTRRQTQWSVIADLASELTGQYEWWWRRRLVENVRRARPRRASRMGGYDGWGV